MECITINMSSLKSTITTIINIEEVGMIHPRIKHQTLRDSPEITITSLDTTDIMIFKQPRCITRIYKKLELDLKSKCQSIMRFVLKRSLIF